MERSETHRKAATLMLVDDDKDLLWLMSHALKRRGFIVKAFDHAPSIAQVKDVRPSVIFLDVDIGTESGEEVCGKIKGSADLSAYPVILLSSHPNDSLRKVASRCGADGYMTKPFDVERMSQLADHYAGLRPAA
ncbi:MAG: response regulator [Flavobacteriales bacterium]